jgi:hypothetical protein
MRGYFLFGTKYSFFSRAHGKKILATGISISPNGNIALMSEIFS